MKSLLKRLLPVLKIMSCLLFSISAVTAFAAEPWAGSQHTLSTPGLSDSNDSAGLTGATVSNTTGSQDSNQAGNNFIQQQVADRSAKLMGTANTSSDNSLAQLESLQNALPNAQNRDQASITGNTDSANTPAPATDANNDQAANANKGVKGVSDNAFSSMVNQDLPMSSAQILRLHELYNETQRAAATTPGVPPKPVSRTLLVQLSPGSTPPVVRLSAGFISTLVFMDSSGAPWAIEAYDLGNPKAYNISWNKKDNMLMVQALTLSTVANIMVKLSGLNTPVMLTLVPDQVAVDYRVDLHVPGLGPNANPLQTNSGLPDGAPPSLLDILNGVTPVGAKVLTVSGSDCEAWLIGKMLYLRTRYHVISPGWYATMSSADGTNAYSLPRTTTVLLSGHGKMMTLKVAGF